MKVKREKKSSWIIIILLGVLLLSSLLGLSSYEEPVNTINVQVQFVLNSQAYTPENENVIANSTIHNLLINLGAAFEQDGDVKSIGQVRNDYLTNNYWQVFVNNELVNNYNNILREGDYIMLYYGARVNIYNITISVNILGVSDTAIVRVQEGVNIDYVLNNYEGLVLENNTIKCLFNLCNDANNSWRIVLNNASINDYNTLLQDNDLLLIEYE